MRKLGHTQAVFVMVLCALLWSTAGVVTRQLESAQSFEGTFWRSAFAWATLLVVLPLWRGRAFWRSLRTGGAALWICAVCWAVMFTAFMVALTLTSTANVLITLAAGPLFTALVTRVFIGHRLPARTWGAIVVGGIGIGWMYASKLGQGEWLGTLVALCVPIAGAIHWTVVQRDRTLQRGSDLVPAVFLGAALSALTALPFAWPSQASVHDIGLLATLGAFQLAIPCVLSVVCASVLVAAEVSLLALLEVIFGIALAWIGANETPLPEVLLGGSLVIGALVVNEWLGWRGRRGAAAVPAHREYRPSSLLNK